MATRPRILKMAINPNDPDDVAEDDAHDLAGDERQDGGEAAVDPDFNEAAYLRAFPDIAEAVRSGRLSSGRAHFQESGRGEGRLEKPEYRALLHDAPKAAAVAPRVSIDAMTVSPLGSTLITGWIDDRDDPLTQATLETGPDSRHVWMAFPRLTRADVNRTLDVDDARLGFMLVAAPTAAAGASGALAEGPVFRFQSGAETLAPCNPMTVSDADLRDLALSALPVAAAGEQDPEAIRGILDLHVGVQIVALNRVIVEQSRMRRMVERVGPVHGRYRASIVTTMRGGAEHLMPRLAVLSAGLGATAFEHIVVITDVARFEPFLRAARLAAAAFGVCVAVVLAPDADPAGLGEDAARDIARSDRLIFMDQAVFPRDPAWADSYFDLVEQLPEEQTRLMGGLLFRVDGSVANAGYYFDDETSWRLGADGLPRPIVARRLRAMGGPAVRTARPARPVPAIPASFLSVDRAFLDRLGGFSRSYARAALEDVDLCLRAVARDAPAWVHPLPMWMLERQGPPRPEPSKGGSLLNDWLLNRQFGELIGSGRLSAAMPVPVA